jgi:aminoglycoside 3-N-acetyltransferase I
MASKRANISKPSETLTPTDRVVRLSAGDRDLAKQLFSLMADVFEEDCERLNDEYVERLLAREEFWAIAAFSGDEIVGGMTAHTLPMTRTASSEVVIYDLAVRGDHRRRGVGRRLVTQLRKEAAALGIGDVFVPADNDDIHALDFYRALGGVASPVTFFTFAPQES